MYKTRKFDRSQLSSSVELERNFLDNLQQMSLQLESPSPNKLGNPNEGVSSASSSFVKKGNLIRKKVKKSDGTNKEQVKSAIKQVLTQVIVDLEEV